MKFNRKYIEDIKTALGRYPPPHRANFSLWDHERALRAYGSLLGAHTWQYLLSRHYA